MTDHDASELAELSALEDDATTRRLRQALREASTALIEAGKGLSIHTAMRGAAERAFAASDAANKAVDE